MANQLFVIHLYLESLMPLKSTDMSCDSALTIRQSKQRAPVGGGVKLLTMNCRRCSSWSFPGQRSVLGFETRIILMIEIVV